MHVIKALIFDWGDTVMRDFPQYSGPMAQWPEVELIPGADTALQALSGGAICCLASNAAESTADLIAQALERVGVREHFQHIFTCHELEARKPDPAFFENAARRIGCRPEECVAIGNAYEKDILPAKQAGMKTVWLTPETDGEAEGADLQITSMNQLAQALQGLDS